MYMDEERDVMTGRKEKAGTKEGDGFIRT